MRKSLILPALLWAAGAMAADVTINADHRSAESVFAEIMRQTDTNFIYPAGLLDGLKVSVHAGNEPLDRVLARMFDGTDIEYRIRGNNVTLRRRKAPTVTPTKRVSGFVREAASGEALPGAVIRTFPSGTATTSNAAGFYSLTVPSADREAEVRYTGFAPLSPRLESRNDTVVNLGMEPDNQLAEVVVTGTPTDMTLSGDGNNPFTFSSAQINSTPVLLGESDVIKTLQLQPGVSAGTAGLAAMHVHGGNADENLYMLDNIPLYQVNHLGGLFSAFNTEAIRSVDFYKSAFPAKYDGRLSSFMDVHTRDGSLTSHHGSLKIGLTSAAFNIDGPIHKGTTSYSVAVRRSWLGVMSGTFTGIVNGIADDGKFRFGYDFTDVNAKVNHRFSSRASAHLIFYYGEDALHSKYLESQEGQWSEDERIRMRWGNIVGKAGLEYVFSPTLFGELTAAYSRYSSHMNHSMSTAQVQESALTWTRNKQTSDNDITDWIFRADFDWRPRHDHRVTFGGGYTRHSFLPDRGSRHTETDKSVAEIIDNGTVYRANEANLYIGDLWTVSPQLRADAGIHLSLFGIDGKTRGGISPRASLQWSPRTDATLSATYSRTVQYVHQLNQSFISLPTDRWVPVTSQFKPQTADKISFGLSRRIGGKFHFSAEAYWKWMHNLVEYRDDYYLVPPHMEWDNTLTTGRGSAKGIDLKIAKTAGRLTGHIAYSLMWADRTFAGRNGGHTYPARCDNRHKINVLLNWKASERWDLNVAWTGMTGNRFTLATQMWEDPGASGSAYAYGVPLAGEVNNFRLPFYHRLDFSAVRHTRHGYWTFGLYNAYCHMNTIGLRRGERDGYTVFQKIRSIPIIPSISYTWKF